MHTARTGSYDSAVQVRASRTGPYDSAVQVRDQSATARTSGLQLAAAAGRPLLRSRAHTPTSQLPDDTPSLPSRLKLPLFGGRFAE